jgi:hypothetical protein
VTGARQPDDANEAHATQRTADGIAASRSAPIGPPQLSHVP